MRPSFEKARFLRAILYLFLFLAHTFSLRRLVSGSHAGVGGLYMYNYETTSLIEGGGSVCAAAAAVDAGGLV